MASFKALPKILIDARMVDKVSHGISRHVELIAESLTKVRSNKKLSYEPVFLMNSSYQWPDIFNGFQRINAKTSFLSPKELIEIPNLLKENEIRLYHTPSFASLIRSPCPWMQTIHDLNHLQWGDFTKKIYYATVLKPFLKGAEKILTVSEFSKNEIVTWSGIDPHSVEVIYTPLPERFSQKPDEETISSVLKRYNLDRGKYFFAPTSLKPHKNLRTLINAYKVFASKWDLLVTAKSQEKVPGIRFIGGVEDEALRVLTSEAGALVFPSLYEGFGLPPLEAAAVGTPLIISKIPTHLEGLAHLSPGEVHWVNPKDQVAWTEALKMAVEGKLKRPSFSSRQRILQEYDVEKFGQKMDQIYSSVISTLP